MVDPSRWFLALLETSPDVFFRYALEPERRMAYVSPAVATLTGHAPEAFYADAGLCFAVVLGTDRRLLRRMLRSRRDLTTVVHLVRDEVAMPVEIHTVALLRRRRLVAIEGVARLMVGQRQADREIGQTSPALEPVQQRLASLLFEVHDLLHAVTGLPGAKPGHTRRQAATRLTCGALSLDVGRLVATEAGTPVWLTPQELKLLRYVLERPDRVITRRQMLLDVWNYHYEGDDRTVDVHVARLRRKLPSLRGRLVALRGLGYRLDVEPDVPAREAAG